MRKGKVRNGSWKEKRGYDSECIKTETIITAIENKKELERKRERQREWERKRERQREWERKRERNREREIERERERKRDEQR